ncbi:surfactin synthase thioesterase subunit [Phyllobacterium ifriqiyense]|uniref:Surfactin synthase thioesterase subunit n=1 Tax=Phyllobacterium ifriqiyense TaxID=314238 RepID=A0ABU0S7M6_9HYPH|nr:surfactin synthase thioesterase subunit [Phyllobacterium ifriqiyense]
MSDKPTVILVHGFWGGAAHWNKVIIELTRMGHANIHAVELPLTSLGDDAERTRKMVAQQSGPVLLVGHSYGGAVITEAMRPMWPVWSILQLLLRMQGKALVLSRRSTCHLQRQISHWTAMAIFGSSRNSP